MGKICGSAFGLCILRLRLYVFYSQFGTLLDTDIFTVNAHLVARFCTAVAINFRGWVWTKDVVIHVLVFPGIKEENRIFVYQIDVMQKIYYIFFSAWKGQIISIRKQKEETKRSSWRLKHLKVSWSLAACLDMQGEVNLKQS